MMDWEKLLPLLEEDDRGFVEEALQAEANKIFEPLPGPQTMAYESEADIIGFGGAAGGGKTMLAVGKALTKHHNVLFVRKEASQLLGIIDEITNLVGSRAGFNGQEKVWRECGPRGIKVEFGSLANPGDEQKQQGRPKDLLVIDEATNIAEAPARFLMGWVRTTRTDVKPQTLLTFNPPTNAEGRWVIKFFAPWLDKKHPNPAQPGELRWYATINNTDMPVEDGRQFVLDGEGKPVYDFDPTEYQGHRQTLIIQPKSRTFIPSRITDNPYLMNTGYMAQLQALPEPLRSQMLYGDFLAGMEDDTWQVIPTAWVEAAQTRWEDKSPKPRMVSLGVDVARGGKDKTVIYRRHEGMWFDRAITYPGTDTPDGPKTAGLAIAAARDGAPMHIDVIGVGSSPYDFLLDAGQNAVGVNVAERASATDKSGRLQFFNLRSQLVWQFREALDPANNTGIALPPDTDLLADLCAYRWSMRGGKVMVESRDDILRRIGRSPDHASAIFLALMDSGEDVRGRQRVMEKQLGLDTLRHREVAHIPHGGYDPYSKME